jgi:DNA modification methylase
LPKNQIKITCKTDKYLHIDELEAFQGKLKSIDNESMEKLKKSILKYGFSFPIFVWRYNILDGHQRLEAVKRLIDDEHEMNDRRLPVVEIQAKDETEAAEKLLLINSRYATIEQDGFDSFISDFSIDIPEIKELLEIPEIDFSLPEDEFEGNTDPDDIPEVEETPVSNTGDIWILGDHRLMCGDSTDEDDVKKLMNGKKAEMVFTSPPYDNQRTYELSEEIKWNDLISKAFGHDIYSDDCQILVNLGLIHKDGEVYRYWDWFIDSMRESGWRFFGWYVWNKIKGMYGDWKGRFTPRHEWILHFNKKSLKLNKIIKCSDAGEKLHGTKDRRKDGKIMGRPAGYGKKVGQYKPLESVIDNYSEKSRTGINHPAMFPISLAQQIIEAFPLRSIYEPFSGSGTTIIAAEQTGRCCFGMEISPQYVDIAVRRWQEFTGKDAVLESTGKTFNDIST